MTYSEIGRKVKLSCDDYAHYDDDAAGRVYARDNLAPVDIAIIEDTPEQALILSSKPSLESFFTQLSNPPVLDIPTNQLSISLQNISSNVRAESLNISNFWKQLLTWKTPLELVVEHEAYLRTLVSSFQHDIALAQLEYQYQDSYRAYQRQQELAEAQHIVLLLQARLTQIELFNAGEISYKATKAGTTPQLYAQAMYEQLTAGFKYKAELQHEKDMNDEELRFMDQAAKREQDKEDRKRERRDQKNRSKADS